MFCVYCGSELPEEARFCTACGKIIDMVEETAVYRCASCGAAIEPDDAFCVSCGKPVQQIAKDPGRGDERGFHAEQPEPITSPEQTLPHEHAIGPNQTMPYAATEASAYDTKLKNRNIVFVVIAVSLVALIAIAFIAIALPGLNGGDNTSAVTNRKSASVAQERAGGESPVNSSTSSFAESDVGHSSKSSSGQTSAVAGTTHPDEAGIVDQAQLRSSYNVFLSNFTEVAMSDVQDSAHIDSAFLVRFVISHDGINSPDYWEDAANAFSSQSGLSLTKCESASRIRELTMRYFEKTPDFANLGPDFFYKDGYVYFDPNGMAQTPQGVASVTGSEMLDGNNVKVYFSVYTGSYDATDETLYSGTQNEIMRRVGATSATYEGVAVIRTGGSNETTNGLVLHSFERVSDGQAQGRTTPFWGVWVFASKNKDEATVRSREVAARGFSGEVFLTTEWSNLNATPWYVVSAGCFDSKEDADDLADEARKAGYEGAYTKYSGDFVR